MTLKFLLKKTKFKLFLIFLYLPRIFSFEKFKLFEIGRQTNKKSRLLSIIAISLFKNDNKFFTEKYVAT
jgi:hypothetical protein